MGKQHYYPASLIGNFSADQSGKRRDRCVWVARRGAPRVLRLKAHMCGVMPRHERLYETPNPVKLGSLNLSLDDLWKMSEYRLAKLLSGLQDIESSGGLSCEWLVTVASPYIGHLLARHPRIALPDLHNLIADYGSGARSFRWALAGVLTDIVLFRLRWTLAIAPEETPWVSSDIGIVSLPGRGAGSQLIPFSPRHAIILSAGTPTYSLGAAVVQVKSYQWVKDDVAVVNDVMALLAPREVYTRDQAQADHVRDVWEVRATSAINRHNVSAAALAGFDAPYTPYFLLQGHRHDPNLSWARFVVACHLFACDCERRLEEAPIDIAEAARVVMPGALESARASLRGPQAWFPATGGPMTGAVLDDTDAVAFANRCGLHVMRSGGAEGHIDTAGMNRALE